MGITQLTIDLVTGTVSLPDDQMSELESGEEVHQGDAGKNDLSHMRHRSHFSGACGSARNPSQNPGVGWHMVERGVGLSNRRTK